MGIGSLSKLGKSLGREIFGFLLRSNLNVAKIAKGAGITKDTLEAAPPEALSAILERAARQGAIDPREANNIIIHLAKEAQEAVPAMPTNERGAVKFRGFHGTPDKTVFDRPRVDMGEPGAWFTSSVQYANDYAKGPEGKIFEADLSMNNPATVHFEWVGGELVPKLGDEVLDVVDNVELVREMQRRGFDGIHMPDGNFSESDEAFVVFSDSQIDVVPAMPTLKVDSPAALGVPR
jgi:hypothetical protein